MIGDTKTDMLTAKRANVRFIKNIGPLMDPMIPDETEILKNKINVKNIFLIIN